MKDSARSAAAELSLPERAVTRSSQQCQKLITCSRVMQRRAIIPSTCRETSVDHSHKPCGTAARFMLQDYARTVVRHAVLPPGTVTFRSVIVEALENSIRCRSRRVTPCNIASNSERWDMFCCR